MDKRELLAGAFTVGISYFGVVVIILLMKTLYWAYKQQK